MISGPFLTDLDSRAEVKGSRDPLGIQSIWTRFGRHVIGNLTNASNSVRDFTVLLLGPHFAARVAEVVGPGAELATFMKWEQLASYARGHINQDWIFRGTERTRANLQEGRITLSAQPAFQTLSSQKLYGIWGLYSMPGRASGLLEGDTARLTLPAREFIEQFYLSRLSKAGFHDGQRIVELLTKEQARIDPDQKQDRALLAAVAGLLKSEFPVQEREFYRKHLLFGGPQDDTEGRQRQLAELITPMLSAPDFPWSPSVINALAKEAEANGESWHQLAFRLRRIAVAERVLAPTSDLFSYLLGCDEVSTVDIAKRIKSNDGWGNSVATVDIHDFMELEAEFAHGDKEAGKRWMGIAQAMAEGDYGTLVALLIQQNKAVMQARGGAAWIEEQNGKLRVRVAEERGSLPERKELADLWRFPYFLNSLRSVAFVLKEPKHE